MAVFYRLLFLPLAFAYTVTVTTPLSMQRPQAIVNEPFSYTIPPDTFHSDSSLSYSALNVPPWLSFNSDTATFSGKPGSGDNGTCSIRVSATAADGVTASDAFTLAVYTPQGVDIENPILDQFQNNHAAVTSGYHIYQGATIYPGVRVPPGWSFSVGFLPIFSVPGRRQVFYSASQPDNRPLPDWLSFNNETITFDGIAPAASALKASNDAGVYRIQVGASDVPNHVDKYEEFTIRVSLRRLEQVRPLELNLTAGYPVDEPFNLLDSFTLQGQPVNKSDIANVTIDGDWHINLANMSIQGKSSDKAAGRQEDVYMVLTDTEGNKANATLSVNYFDSIFTGELLGPIYATPGDRLTHALGPYLRNSSQAWSLTTTFDPASSAQWTLFDETHMEINSDVPSDTPFDEMTVHMKAQDLVTGAWSHADLRILLAEEEKGDDGKKGLSDGTLAGIAAVVVLNVVMCGIFVWLWMRRRKRKQEGDDTERAEGYDEDGGDKVAGPIYEIPVEKADNGIVGGWHKKAATTPDVIINTLAMPDTPNDSPKSIAKYLTNPFSAKAKARPPISYPILQPSYSNAAFQASLAIAVDAGGIVKRGGTFDSQTVTAETSEFTPSGTYTGAGSTMFTGISHATDMLARSEYTDLPTSEYTEGYTTTTATAEAAPEASDSEAPNSSVMAKRSSGETQTTERSDRASWESDAPFVWNTEVGGGQGKRESADSRFTGTTGISEGRHTEFETTESEETWDPPVQRSDFRPKDQREIQVVTPEPLDTDEGFSIDQIHFPTDSDIARTEHSLISDPSEAEGAAVITTAARIDARRTLESPMTNSPQSDITERMSSPIVAVHSRLVNFGKQKTVTVTPSTDRRSASQTAVVSTDEGSPAQSVRTRESNDSGETTPVARPRAPIGMPSRGSGSIKSNKKRHQHTRSKGSISRSRSPTPPMPDSFPSLPALPTAYSLASAKSAKSITSTRTHHSQMAQTRVLLGVNEPFHFYPPLMLASATLASTQTAFTDGLATDENGKPITPEGATYAVYGERGAGLVEMPDWLHFEEMELWGVPGDDARGKWDIRVIEQKEGERDRIVGRFALEVNDMSARDVA